MRYLTVIFAAIVLYSCSGPRKTKEIGERYFELYSEKASLDKMLSFYSDDSFYYENVSFESTTESPEFLFNQIYGWHDSNFQYETKNILQVDEIIAGDSSIVARGMTMPYSYQGNRVEGTSFVIWLHLDKDMKIKKQIDWYDYPMLEIIEAWQLKQSLEIQ